MQARCGCAECRHPACPPVNAEPPYDEISHEVENNIISIKVPKDTGKIQRQQQQQQNPEEDGFYSYSDSLIEAVCTDAQGKQCREGCAKINVISNEPPPPKRPEEEMLLLRSIRQFMPNDDLKSTLEIEFKAPRNYTPLPDPGPPPPIIIPKTNFGARMVKQRAKGKSKANKK